MRYAEWAPKQGIQIGIFYALHTYSLQLNQHPHVHFSITRVCLYIKDAICLSCFSKKKRSKKSGEALSSR
ncbi:MAG: transposase [Arsenophonus sp. NEOnobi-MAG3]